MSILKKKNRNVEEDDLWASVSDLMSGLMIVFLFISVSFMSRVTQENIQMKKEQTTVKQLVGTYKQTKGNIYDDLYDEFKGDMDKWKMEIDKDGTIRFKEPEVFFLAGKAELKPEFTKILDNFFPRYINVINKNYEDIIEEIRIEGYTSSEWGEKVSKLDSYFLNMELSQNRTRNVLEYVMKMDNIKPYHSWLIEHVTANGMSYSHRIYKNNKEDKQRSRRVEFKIITNSEATINNILEEYKK